MIKRFLPLFPFWIGVALPQSVAVFLPNTFFRDEEYQIVTMALERAKFQVVVVATETTAVQGIDGLYVKPQRLLSEIAPEEFAGLILIDGPGAVVYWGDTVLHRVCQQFATAQRVLGACGLSPIILAKAGLLRGKRATVFPDHYSIGLLKANGCYYRFGPVVSDGNIVTGDKSENCRTYARTLIKVLKRR